jgi:phosphoglycerate dehydrogenase-like enzyme
VKIVIADRVVEAPLASWRARFPGVEFVPAATLAEQVAAVRDADAYLGRIPREAFLAAGPRLRWVHSSGAGIEALAAIPELVESAVTVTNTRGAHATCIADHTLGMLLALTRKLPNLLADQREQVWKRPGVTTGMRALSGATMVIVGLGSIGRAVARRALAFEMRVLGVDARPEESARLLAGGPAGTPRPGGPAMDSPPGPPAAVAAVWGIDRLEEALAQADALVLSVPLTPETRHLLDARRLALLKPGAYVLAVSRGGIVDEPALIAALQEGRLAGAGLDVQEHEPLPPGDPLWAAPNLILTPHCAGASDLTRERVWEITEENLRRFLTGEPLLNLCDKRAGF